MFRVLKLSLNIFPFQYLAYYISRSWF